MRSTTIATLTLIVPLSLSLGCATDAAPDDAFRVLPVAAVMADGSEVLVGTYDAQSRELDLVPAFVEELDSQSRGTSLQLTGAGHTQPLAVHGVWADGLDEGSRLAVAIRAQSPNVAGAELVVHAETWTDGLTEAEAASSYSACWDIPEHCWDPALCEEVPQDECEHMFPECFMENPDAPDDPEGEPEQPADPDKPDG
ncbi:MAG: hypothetical protein K0V04_28760 [Deltaproteobacteria bacterium]|nr:hypothetical protein [Deltaproteobacteria bacterium]